MPARADLLDGHRKMKSVTICKEGRKRGSCSDDKYFLTEVKDFWQCQQLGFTDGNVGHLISRSRLLLRNRPASRPDTYLIAIKFCTGINDTQRKNAIDFGDPLTFPVVTPRYLVS